MKITGDFASRRVWVDGVELSPRASQRVMNHSPDGFNWSYGGSGPAQLALAILLKHGLTRDRALALYQDFKWKVIAKLPAADFTVEIDLSPWH